MGNEENLQEELGNIVNEANSSAPKKDEMDPMSTIDDETLEIKKEGMYSEKVIVTEQVRSKLTAFFTKFGLSYGSAKSLLIILGIVILVIAGYLFYTGYQESNEQGKLSGVDNKEDFEYYDDDLGIGIEI